MDIRERVVQALLYDGTLSLAVGDRIYQYSAAPDNPGRPFLVVKGGFSSKVSAKWRGGPTHHPLEVWVHDTPGDYLQIDTLGSRVSEVIEGLASSGSFLEARFIGGSTDLEDDALGTILRVFHYQLTTST